MTEDKPLATQAEAPAPDKDAELLELSGWLKSEVTDLLYRVQHWAHGHGSDKSLAFELVASMDRMKEMISAITNLAVREHIREEHRRQQEELPF